MKRANGLVGLCLLCLVYLVVADASEEHAPTVIEAQHFSVVDSGGKKRASFGVEADGSIALLIGEGAIRLRYDEAKGLATLDMGVAPDHHFRAVVGDGDCMIRLVTDEAEAALGTSEVAGCSSGLTLGHTRSSMISLFAAGIDTGVLRLRAREGTGSWREVVLKEED